MMTQSPQNETIAQQVLKEFDELSGERTNWESHWTEIAQLFDPSSQHLFQSFGNRTTGEKRNEFIFDSTAPLALSRFAAILDSLLTPRNQTWHRIMPSDPYLAKQRRVRLYFEEANQLLFKYRYAPKANFSSQNQANYKALGAYGTGCLFTDSLKAERGLRYRAVNLGEIYFAENHQGIVDKAVRRFELTARQAVQKWPKTIGDEIRKMSESNQSEVKIEFVHCVKPRNDYDPERVDEKGKPWGSYYVCKKDKKLVADEGYETFPYAISRYTQVAGEVYGRSPAMDVLPAVKTLNEEKKAVLKQGHRALDPIYLLHDDGIMDTMSAKPGAMVSGAVSADGRPLVHTLQPGNIVAGKELMDDERTIINDSFLITIFQILTENPQMTATEVMERTREKGILLAPTIGRQQSEYLGPLIEREMDLLSQQGLLPSMPEELLEAAGEYKIEYDSPISRAQRAEESSGIMRTLEAALNIANITQSPAPLDFFNLDVIMPELADNNGVPSRWMKTIQEVQKLREGRTQQMQQEQMINAAPGMAAIMKAGAAVAKK